VFFDDLTITHTESPIIQEDHYYPYGLTMRGLGKQGSNPFKYNGKEEQDELDLGWMDYGARMYDPVLGRFNSVDPHASAYQSLSHYSYVGNNPIAFIDPTGMDSVRYDDLPSTKFDPENDVVILDEVVITPEVDDCRVCKDDKSEGGLTIPLTLPITSIFESLPSLSGVSILSRLSPILMILTLSGDTRVEPIPIILTYQPPPLTLPGFPNSIPAKRKAGRKRWLDDNGDILEWDSQHGEVEVYDKTGKKHKGGYDPDTGEQTSDPVSGRTTPK